MRALRLLHRHLPHLPAAGRRAGQPARAHLPDQAGARRPRPHARHPAAPGPLPDLPELRNHLPQRRAIWPPDRHWPQSGRCQGAAPPGRTPAALGAERGPELAPVCPGDEAGPGRAQPVARRHPRQGARQKRTRHLAGTGAPAQGAAAGRLRATGDAAQHQLRHRPGAGCRGHPNRGHRPGRVLRRGEIPPERPRRRQRPDAGQHRCLVAGRASR